ncbi:phosphoesterase [Bacillus phage Mater]|uniref:Phosphoesterase n=1 Tax=Bacillus phage Mater TaxID=1540090 RepID=A0A0A0RUM0_9CAUD|nr:phosphoesterase [Bacillus phage Mater]AIW03263.1 phosphoesterase [Bacillus phage Mater]
MSKAKLTELQLELLGTEEGAAAAVMGYLKAERGKVAPSVFNKLFTELGYPKYNKDDLIKISDMLENDSDVAVLFDKAFEREIKLENIPNAVGDDTSLAEEDVFAKVTSFLIANEDNNARLRELRKLQRDGVYMNILMKNLKQFLVDELQGMPRAKYLQTPKPAPQKGDRNLIILLSDWHVGALVFNKDTGGYDFKKLTGQMQSILEQVMAMIDDLNIKNVYMFHVGDLIEHISMRNVNQAFESEFPATHQIAKANRLVIDMLLTLSKHVHVTFGMVTGNHDRFDGNKADKVYNDNATYIVLDILFLLQDTFGQLPNVTLIDNREDTYEFTVKVAGKNIKVKHGDSEKKKDDVKITKHIKEEPIDYLILGHIHTNRIIQEDYARFHIYVSSPMGGNNYAKELNFPTTQGSQMAMVLTEGSDTPYFIPMMFNKEGKVQ